METRLMFSENSEGVSHNETNIVENMFYYDQNEDISENMNEASVLSSEFDAFYDPFKLLSNIRQKKILNYWIVNYKNSLIIVILILLEFSSLASMTENNMDIFLISETKIDSSFSTAQFQINGFTT